MLQQSGLEEKIKKKKQKSRSFLDEVIIYYNLYVSNDNEFLKSTRTIYHVYTARSVDLIKSAPITGFLVGEIFNGETAYECKINT